MAPALTLSLLSPAPLPPQDGGYHVSVAHPELASGLDLATYRSTLCERLSIQSCQPAAAAAAAEAGEAHAGTSGGSAGEQGMWRRQRIAGGRPPAYVFIYPNLMLNRQAQQLKLGARESSRG